MNQSEGKRKRKTNRKRTEVADEKRKKKRTGTEIDDDSTGRSDRNLNGSSIGLSDGTATSSTVAGAMNTCSNINDVNANTLTVNNYFGGRSDIGQKPDMTNASSKDGKIFKTETTISEIYNDNSDRTAEFQFFNDPDNNVNKRFVSSDPPVPDTIDYKLEVITEQLDIKLGSIHCFSTPRLIPSMGLRGVGEQPDCVTHHFVMMKEGYRPVVFAVTKSQDVDVKQYLRRLSQAVSEKMRRQGTGPVTVAGESICHENLNHEEVMEKLELHKISFSTPVTPVINNWERLMLSLHSIHISTYLNMTNVFNFLELCTSAEEPLLGFPHLCWQYRRPEITLTLMNNNELFQIRPEKTLTLMNNNEFCQISPEKTLTLMNNNEFATSLTIMGSERTMFIDTKSIDHRLVFGLEMAFGLNQDGGTLFIGNSGIEIPSEVCKEVVDERPTTFNDKDRVLGCRHVVVFTDKRKDLDKYKTILRSGGKLLVFLCDNT